MAHERESRQRHVLYELNGIADGRDLLEAVLTSDEPFVESHRRLLVNAALESMLVHARNIIDFVVGRPPGEGRTKRRQQPNRDIVPSDFVRAWEVPDGEHRLDKWLRQIDKHLSHLSKERGCQGDDGPEWHDALLWEVAEDIEEFVAAARATDPAFGAALTQAISRFAPTARPTRSHHTDGGPIYYTTN